MQSILGTMTFSDQVDRDNAASMIKTFIGAGHNHLDTAYVYNKGKTEEISNLRRRSNGSVKKKSICFICIPRTWIHQSKRRCAQCLLTIRQVDSSVSV